MFVLRFKFQGWVGGFPLCDWIKFQKQGGLMEEDITLHGMDVDTSFVEFLGLQQQHAETGSVASNDGLDDVSLGLSEPSRSLHSEVNLRSSCLDAEVARELECLEANDSETVDGHFNVSLAVQVASQTLSSSTVKPIWETGVWSEIFGASSSSVFGSEFLQQSFRRPFLNVSDEQIDRETSLAKPAKALRAAEDFHDVVKFKLAGSWQEQAESGWQQAVKLWFTVISRWDHRCKTLRDLSNCETDIDGFEMLADIFRGRSFVKLKKRAFAVNRICNFLEQSFKPKFPCCESDLYQLYRDERYDGAPVSRIRGYNQAINFCLHVLGVDELKSCADSRRCSGAGKSDDPKERIQASPLKVAELQKLHDTLHGGDSSWTSYFCGCVLLCTYARARWGDLMRAERLIVDSDDKHIVRYIEVLVGRHKTMHAQQHRHAFLPMVAPAFGIDPRSWADRWLQLRQDLKILNPLRHAIMPAPDQWGDVTDRPIETVEAGAWLRKVLFGSKTNVADRRVSTHSLKSTFLSYAAKRGISVPERLQMGYHTSTFQMAMVYSRDGASSVLMCLEKLIHEIQTGKFLPDVTRSGRVVNVDEPAASVVDLVKTEGASCVVDVSDSDSSASASSSSSDSHCDSDQEDTRMLSRMFQPPVAPEGFVMWQHSKLKTLHLMDSNNSRVFECGRTAGSFHSNEGIAPRYDTPICRRCFKAAALP